MEILQNNIYVQLKGKNPDDNNNDDDDNNNNKHIYALMRL